MDIKGLRGLSSLFQGNRGSAQELLQEAASRREENRAERQASREQRSSDIRAILEQRREARTERGSDATPPPEVTPPVEETPSGEDQVTILPVEPPTESSPVQVESIDDLAELYVRQFETGSGVTLSEEAFDAKKAEVADFYSGIRGGQERLDAIVFANDQTTDTTA